ncbi:MAG: MgtC/SapB family protein [Candidatus Nanosalina sp.]
MFGVPELLMEVVTATAIGGLIGLEREHAEQKKYAGIRTLSLLGGIAPGVVAASEHASTAAFVAVYLALAAAISVGVAVVRFHVEGEDMGFTTSAAVFVVAVLGLLVGYNLYSEATSIAILVTLLLAEKRTLHSYVDKLKKEEISRALQLGALAFVLLPVLPSTAVGPFSAIVPQQVLLLAIFVLSIEFLSYISLRQLQTAGIYLTGALGGGASSFATTGVMARMARERPEILKPASAAVNLATLTMVARNIGIATLIFLPVVKNSPLQLSQLYFPVIGLSIPLLAASYLSRAEESEGFDMEIDSPFSLRSGAKFALVFVAVSITSVAAEELLGVAGVYLTAFTGGLVSSAAVVTSAATSFTSGSIGMGVASAMILLSIAGSIVSKMLLVEIANQEMRSRVSIPMLFAITAGIIVFLLQ